MDDGVGAPRAARSLGEVTFDRRVLFLSGELDDARAGDLSLALMSLDANGDDPIDLFINCAGRSLDAALAVMDTIDLLGVPVRAMCSGRAEGPVVGILAVCHQRRSGRHAQIRLHLPEERFHGEPGEAEAWLAHRVGRVDRFVERLSQATAQSPDRVRSDLERGALLDADVALAYGLLDEVVGRPDAEVISFPATDRPPDDSR